MFTLHETTRRGLCRLGFVLLAVVPACAILSAAAWLGSDARRVEHERELSQRLGLAVTLKHVLLTRPDCVRYEDLLLSDPETNQPLALAKSLEVSRQNDTVTLTAVEPELSGLELDALYDILSRQLRQGKAGEKLRTAAKQVILHMNGGSTRTLYDLECHCIITDQTAQAELAFSTVKGENSGPIRVRIARNRQTNPASVELTVDSSQSPLPCSMIASFLPTVVQLGPDCQFQGTLLAVKSPAGWSGNLEGKFGAVDLAALASSHFPGQISGSGQLVIKSARFRGGRIESMDGALVARDGAIHQSLATTMKHELGCPCVKLIDIGTEHPFDELNFGFALDSSGLLLSGRCGSGGEGTLLADQLGIAIKEPPQRQPLERVIFMLAPANDVFMPLSRTTAGLTGVLPLPGERGPVQTADPRGGNNQPKKLR